MASATGIPQDHPATIEARADEPLLGRPGDVTQKPDESIYRNLFTGECAKVFADRKPTDSRLRDSECCASRNLDCEGFL